MDNPGNQNNTGDAWISCKAMGYDSSSPGLDQKYKKIGWNNQPFSCQISPDKIDPRIE